MSCLMRIVNFFLDFIFGCWLNTTKYLILSILFLFFVLVVFFLCDYSSRIKVDISHALIFFFIFF